jgi:non-canonical (house-cleaning) NTP pyrophosphatase
MKIIVGTNNQKKLSTVLAVFEAVLAVKYIEIVKHDAKSGVPEAPHNEETYQGALNRALECQAVGSAEYYVGIESGLVDRYGHLFEEAWAVVISHEGTRFIGYSSGLLLPDSVRNRMIRGEKHNDTMAYFDTLFKLPPDNKDTWSRYTGGAISRQVSLEECLRNALIQSVDTTHNLYKYIDE